MQSLVFVNHFFAWNFFFVLVKPRVDHLKHGLYRVHGLYREKNKMKRHRKMKIEKGHR